MVYNFDDYLNSVKHNIKNKKLHAPICAELESHLRDSADFYVEIGYDEETATKKALEDMGEPENVGESMAKLYKLSGWQKFFIAFFMFAATIKVLDIVIANTLNGGWWLTTLLMFHQPRDAFVLSGEIINLLITVTAGVVVTLYTKRKSPVITSLVVLLLDVHSLWCFSSIIWMAVKGELAEYLKEAVAPTAVDYIVITVSAILIFFALLLPVICVIRAVNKPFSDSRKLNKTVKIFMLSFTLVLSAVYLVVFTYVDRKDKEQFELYSQVVADMCDLCEEKGRITADDFEEVKERFDYLEIVEMEPDDYNNEYDSVGNYYYAVIGDGLMINSHLYVNTYSDGSFEFSAEADRLMYNFDLTLRFFKTSRYLNYNNRWEGSDIAAMSISDFLENVQSGDSIDEYLETVKETGSDFYYCYDADGDTNPGYFMITLGTDSEEPGYKTADGAIECYSTYLDMSGLFGQWYFDVYADNGKFVCADEMID